MAGDLVVSPPVGVGIGEAGCAPAAHSLISDHFPANHRGRALATYQLGVPIGILVGSYSSIFVASSLVAMMKSREQINVAVARKVESRGLSGESTRAVSADDVALGSTATRSTADRPRAGNAPPRPRKKKKKR